MIKIDPRNSQRILVAAYGPLWNAGGQRGIYGQDGGITWDAILKVDEHTGFNEIHIDRLIQILCMPLLSAKKKVFTYISGGPGSAIYKTIDGGLNWNKINTGLPTGDLGRIGLALSYHDNQVLYAIVEHADEFYKSANAGASWSKQSDKKTSGNYYQEIFVIHTVEIIVMDS